LRLGVNDGINEGGGDVFVLVFLSKKVSESSEIISNGPLDASKGWDRLGKAEERLKEVKERQV
jgi:hypothetical protein